jgi:hypothetical protein
MYQCPWGLEPSVQLPTERMLMSRPRETLSQRTVLDHAFPLGRQLSHHVSHITAELDVREQTAPHVSTGKCSQRPCLVLTGTVVHAYLLGGSGVSRAWLNPSYAVVVVTTFETLIAWGGCGVAKHEWSTKANSAHDMHMRWTQQIWKHEMMSLVCCTGQSRLPRSPLLQRRVTLGTSHEVSKTTFRTRAILHGVSLGPF